MLLLNLLSKLDIADPDHGLPRQPVMVRLAFKVSGLSFIDFLSLFITAHQDRGFMYLTAYRYTDHDEHGNSPVSPRYYARALETPSENVSLEQLLARLPRDHYVWSDELADAVHQFTMNDPNLAANSEGIQWNPDLAGMDDLIKDVETPSEPYKPKQPPKKKTSKTAARNQRWRKECEKRMKTYPKLSKSAVVQQIAKSPELNPKGRKPGTIRRILNAK